MPFFHLSYSLLPLGFLLVVVVLRSLHDDDAGVDADGDTVDDAGVVVSVS